MGCTKCGSDTQLIQLLLDKYIRDAIEDGRIQEGLRDCNTNPLRRDTNVITCELLEDAICQLITEGRVCLDKPIMLDYDKSTGVLKLVMSNGESMTTKLDANDIHISSMKLLNDTLTLSYNTGQEPLSVDLSGYKSKVSVTEDSDGNIIIADGTGVTKTIPAPIKFNETITKQGDKYGVNPEFHKDKVSATLNADGSITLTDGAGNETKIPAPVEPKPVEPIQFNDTITKQGNLYGVNPDFHKDRVTAKKNADGSVTLTDGAGTTTEIASPNRTVVLKNSSGKTVVAYAHKTEN